MIEVSKEMKELYIETAKSLKGSDKRLFMARVVKSMGRGGQSYAKRELGWHRGLVSKGTVELETGVVFIDNFAGRGRKKSEVHFPNLLEDIREIADSYSQTDPTFQTTKLYMRLGAPAVRQRLIDEKGYEDETMPCVETINNKLNELGYRLKKVQKTKPQKK